MIDIFLGVVVVALLAWACSVAADLLLMYADERGKAEARAASAARDAR